MTSQWPRKGVCKLSMFLSLERSRPAISPHVTQQYLSKVLVVEILIVEEFCSKHNTVRIKKESNPDVRYVIKKDAEMQTRSNIEPGDQQPVNVERVYHKGGIGLDYTIDVNLCEWTRMIS